MHSNNSKSVLTAYGICGIESLNNFKNINMNSQNVNNDNSYQPVLENLENLRRKKHPCVNPGTGDLEDKLALWLTVIGGCLTTPLLVFIG
jgi:hypothetical protein